MCSVMNTIYSAACYIAEGRMNMQLPLGQIFKLGNHFFAHALDYFVLDGWVTEHVRPFSHAAT